ncbi:hypothetical protein VQ643_14760 [Pseudomonas sp. F1_0610]|uniref:hypothetical protein n=1 Tax=Pseudomonas sp. F1_0610 TaxID=3114284 RepID=UPI0039C212E6
MKKILLIAALASLLQGCLVPSENVQPNTGAKTQKLCKSNTKDLFNNLAPSKDSIQLIESGATLQVLFKQSGLKSSCQLNAHQHCQFISERNKNLYTSYDLDVSNPEQLLVRSYTYGNGMLHSTTFNSYRCQ